jgi:hypothetical protein
MEIMVSGPLRTITVLFFLVAVSFKPATSSAAVITFSDRTVFNSLGDIAFNSNFNDFGPGVNLISFVTTPNWPFVRGDVSYASVGGNWSFGPNSGIGGVTLNSTAETLIGDLDLRRIIGDIADAPQYNLFGFDIGAMGPGGIHELRIQTNLGAYTYIPSNLARAHQGQLEFWGFAATGAEFFTSFSINVTPDGQGRIPHPGITNVAVGQVPEPTSLVVLGIGLIGLGLHRRLKRKAPSHSQHERGPQF